MKKGKFVLLLVILLLLIVACGKETETAQETPISLVEDTRDTEDADVPEEKPEQPVIEEPEKPIEVEAEERSEPNEIDLTGMALNPLTGLYIPEEVVMRRPIGIMINNHSKAMPQSGLSQADIIYETLVEGGITRLFAVYKDFDAEKIGPIRSARHYFLDFAFDFDALYVHYGQSPQATAAFKHLNPPNMNGLSYLDTIMCFQDPLRRRPHSTYTSYDRLMAAWQSKQYRTTHKEGFVDKFNFSDEVIALEEGQKADKITLNYSYYQLAWFDYDAESMTYLRNQFGGPHMDVETDEQLEFTNIIIQLTDMWKIPGDTEGRMDMALSSKGTGYYISQGKAMPITWSKLNHYDPTQYFTQDGHPLEMSIGKTWISVFPTYRSEGLIIE